MPVDNILVIAVDGLRASALGAYGNTWFATPVLDHLAAESFLLDAHFGASIDLPSIYRSLWQSSLPAILGKHGYQSTLVTDDPRFPIQTSAVDFDSCVQLTDQATTLAQSVEETSMARLFSVASEVVQQADGPRLTWIHASGLYGPWDAPQSLRESLREEGDPPPSQEIQPPDQGILETDDPDLAFMASCGYAAQIMVLDACLESLLETLQVASSDASSGNPGLIVLLGTRGFPLGEHRRLGGVDDRLYAEQLHVPCLLRFPDGRDQLARSGQLTSHVDLLPTLLDWVTEKAPKKVSHENGNEGLSMLPLAQSQDVPWREVLLSTSSTGSQAIRTPHWCLRSDSEILKLETCELFVRPDDRWEANDVAGLCPEVVEALRAEGSRQ